ncbi:MAG: DUF1127 domain-containing protein [Proteobacteria bacterium]|nr:MAG: DUF1127 domain-containing protein [Pseudomonadota bacterium]
MSSLYVLYDNPELNLRVRRATPLFQIIKRMVVSVQDWNRARLARRDLSEMPDYILSDIGIERSAIESIATAHRRR